MGAGANSKADFDAVGRQGERYQIRGRRIGWNNPSCYLSLIRDLEGGHFHFLAGVEFAPDFTVLRAAIIPHAVVASCAAFEPRGRTYTFLLHAGVLDQPGVRDVTAELKAVNS